MDVFFIFQNSNVGFKINNFTFNKKNRMGLFNKEIELTKDDFDKINAILPSEIRKDFWGYNEIIEGGLNRQYVEFRDKIEVKKDNLKTNYNNLKRILDSKKENSEEYIASKTPIFNTDIYEAKPLGMIDVGIVKQFGTASTGNRFENGVLGYAIEGALDKAWSENNTQFAAVQTAKIELLKEAKRVHKDCNCIFKFEIDFRELGSSGNVFIYARGTACKGDYKNSEILEKEFNMTISIEQKELDTIESEWEELKLKLDKLSENSASIPESKYELKKLLEK